MDVSSSVPLPINFNRWKHHTGFIKQQIQTFSQTGNLALLKKQLLKIGDSQMDLYFGKLAPSEISKEIIFHLKKEKSFSFDKYIGLLKREGRDYKFVRLSDKSIWTLRLSENSERYVHIHPGRYSLHTIRVKATTLKTAILVLSFLQLGKLRSVDTELVNQIRKKQLNEPPLKSISKASGICRAMELLRE